MTNCKGIMGRIFGHKFQSKLIRVNPVGKFNVGYLSSFDLEKMLSHSELKEYIVLCQRCGEQRGEQ